MNKLPNLTFEQIAKCPQRAITLHQCLIDHIVNDNLLIQNLINDNNDDEMSAYQERRNLKKGIQNMEKQLKVINFLFNVKS